MNLFVTYEEQVQKYNRFRNNPRLNFEAVRYEDLPWMPKAVICPVRCSEEELTEYSGVVVAHY